MMFDGTEAFSVSDFVAYVNQTLEYAYPAVVITGELANFKVSKNRWVYFDLKDDTASVRFFGTVYNLAGPLEDGMMLAVRGVPRVHPQFGFSVTIQQLQLVGEGTMKRAAALLEAKLAREGLFDPSRKRPLPYPPQTVGLITSGESAAYADFTKIIRERWAGLSIVHFDVQVQGADAPEQLVRAITQANQLAEPLDVLVLIRGGGSADDLQAFQVESVVRAVAASRIPTLAAIGHESDTSLVELAADVRASTPSNAAELLTPDKAHVLASLQQFRENLAYSLRAPIMQRREALGRAREKLAEQLASASYRAGERLRTQRQLLEAYDPHRALERGFAIIRRQGTVLRAAKGVEAGDGLSIMFADGVVNVQVESVEKHEENA